MIKRVKRGPGFNVVLEIEDDNFIAPPRAAQRNWLVNQAMQELSDDLFALDEAARRFVPGSEAGLALGDRTQAKLEDDEIMEPWQVPLMRAMCESAARPGSDVLEVGFGLGVAAGFIQSARPRSHTIIECNDSVVERFEKWRLDFPTAEIKLVHGLWQDVLDGLGAFDGIVFHTYPLNETEYIDHIAKSVTFAEHFFAHAAAHLRSGGRFTYLSFEIDTVSRRHQRALFQSFREVQIRQAHLEMPIDVADAWWSDSMALVTAIK